MLLTLSQMRRIGEQMPHLEFRGQEYEIISPEDVDKKEARRIIAFERDYLSHFGKKVKNIDSIKEKASDGTFV